MRESVDGEFVTGKVSTFDKIWVLEDLAADHEQSCFLIDAVKIIIQLGGELGRAVIIGDTPLSLRALNNVIRSSAKGESPVTVSVVLS